MEKFLKAFIIILSSLAALLLMIVVVDSMGVHTRAGIMTITDKQIIGGKIKYKTQYVGKMPMQVPYYEPAVIRISAKLNTGQNATFDLASENDTKVLVGESYLCRYYVSRLTRVPRITEIYYNE